MSRYFATSVEIQADCDYGEGWVAFQWPDEVYGYEELHIDLDGHCSRRMPVHSGEGPPEFAKLRRDAIRLRFAPGLAAKLQLPHEIELWFRISDDDYAKLRQVVEYFNGSAG